MRLRQVLAEIDIAHVTMLGAMIAGLVIFQHPKVFGDGDTFWHVATGRWIFEHLSIPRTDPFSFTAAGTPWQAHEWLSEVLIAGAFQIGGSTGIALLFGAVGALTAGLVAGWAQRSLGGWMLPCLVAGGLAITNESLLVRPHILALPLIVAWTIVMLRAREKNAAPPMLANLLLVVWANLHASYALAGLIAAVFALEAVLAASPEARLRAVRDWGVFGLGALVAVCLTPFGPAGLMFPIKLMSMSILPDIQEWLPVSFAEPSLIEVVILLGVFALVASGARMPKLRLALLLLLLHMALQHGRQLPILGVVAPLLMAAPLAVALKSPPVPSTQDWRAPALAFAMLSIVVVALRISQPVQLRDSAVAPIAAVASLDPAIRAQPVFNDYAVGGYLIFEGVKPYIDGRADMYGDKFVGDYMALIRKPAERGLAKTLDSHKIAWTLFPPQSPVVSAIDGMPGWKRVYEDRWFVVQARSSGPAKEVHNVPPQATIVPR